MIIKFTLECDKFVSKPTGKLTKKGTIAMNFGAYGAFKSLIIKQLLKQKTRKPLSKIYGVIIEFHLSKRKGHPPDVFNLNGAIADCLTTAKIWTDDNINVVTLESSLVKFIPFGQKQRCNIYIASNRVSYLKIISDLI